MLFSVETTTHPCLEYTNSELDMIRCLESRKGVVVLFFVGGMVDIAAVLVENKKTPLRIHRCASFCILLLWNELASATSSWVASSVCVQYRIRARSVIAVSTAKSAIGVNAVRNASRVYGRGEISASCTSRPLL